MVSATLRKTFKEDLVRKCKGWKIKFGKDPQKKRQCGLHEITAAIGLALSREMNGRGKNEKEVFVFYNAEKQVTWKVIKETDAGNGRESKDCSGRTMVEEGAERQGARNKTTKMN